MSLFNSFSNSPHFVELITAESSSVGSVKSRANRIICVLPRFAYRAAKDQKKATKATKKASQPAAAKKSAPKQKAAKNVQKAAPRVGGKR